MTDTALVERLWDAGCIFAEDEARLLEEAAAGDAPRLEQLAQRRIDGEPLEHVLGWAEFDGHRYVVGPGVFVPRPRSEAIIAAALTVVPVHDDALTILDMCCGTGALGAALMRRLQPAQLQLVATDIDPQAVACARENLAPFAARVYEGDLFAALPRALQGSIDLIVANVPYVPTADIELMNSEARDYEPHVALDGGLDGLDVFTRFTAEARHWLRPGGSLLSEMANHQVEGALDAMRRADLVPVHHRDDELEANVVIGTAR